MGRIYLAGSSHVSSSGASRLAEAIRTVAPGVVALELCPGRLRALEEGPPGPDRIPGPRSLGLRRWLLVRLLSGLQERYARLAGAEVGTDMLSALRAARAEGLPVALIDDDIGSTMEGLARSVGPRDLLRFAVRAVRPDPWARRLDLTAVPDDELVEEMLRELERAFPRAHDVLVRRRDLRMASRLLRLASEHGTVLAVVGAGHKSGIRRLLTGSPHEVTLLAL